MFDPLEISRYEAGIIRVFALDLTEAEIDLINTPKPDHPPRAAALAQLVGLDWIDEGYAELFHTDDLDKMGLGAYLIQGQGVPEALIAPQRLQLAQIDGYVLILLTKAFEDFNGAITLPRSTQLIGAFAEEGMDISFEPLPSRAATEAANLAAPPVNSHLVLLKIMALVPAVCLGLGLILWLLLR